ncbi:LOW QUALITY PROTEIN: WD repeat-containing protein 74 [Menidia menidia]
MGEQSRLCSVWLGAETGILKGVSLDRKQAFNFCNTRHLTRDREVRALAWADAAESELLVGSADGHVRTFSTEKGAFTCARRCGDAQDGGFCGLAPLGDDSSLVTCTETGLVRVWREDSSDPVTELRAGACVSRMRQSPVSVHVVATGGRENGLKLWDLQRPHAPLFAAKNLRDDFLQLRRPQWVRDMRFLPDSDKMVTCTGYHQVHVFDPASPRRRPVLEAEFGEHPLTALALAPGGGLVAVGNTVGQLALLDLRRGGRVCGVLKGMAGGVRGLESHAHQPIMASCGLDRVLRIHSLENRQLMHRVYLKSRLNCLLLASRPLEGAEPKGAGPEVKEEEEEEGDEVWDAMERVGEEATKRKSPEEEEDSQKRRKKKD